MNSVVFDINAEAGSLCFSNGRVVCRYCGYLKHHVNIPESPELPDEHYTCLCLLFESAVVCCAKGYANLLSYVPSIALYTPIPQCTSEDHISGLETGLVTISREKFFSLTEECIQAKVVALSNYPYIRSSFLPIKFE
jgi:hypothetical protein